MTIFRKLLLVLAFGLLAMLIPGTVIKSIAPVAAAPNFLLILTVYLAFYEGSPGDALLAFLLGLMLDLGSLDLLGPWAGAYVIVFAVLVLLSQRIFIESGLVVFATVFCAAVMADFLYLWVLSLVYDARALTTAFIAALWEGLFSAALAPLFFPLLKRWLRGAEREAGMPSAGIMVRRRR